MWATSASCITRGVLCAVGLAVARLALAAPDASVTDADIEAVRRKQPIITDQDVRRAREQNRAPSDEGLRRVPIPAAPRIDKLPRPAVAAPIDLEALARGFDARTSPAAVSPAPGPSVLVFISFAMPDATLARLAEQASKAQATLVLRGLVDGSMVRTVSRVQRLIAENRVAVQIDPQAFDRFAVTRTPTFVLVKDQPHAQPCANGLCLAVDGYALVSGDVSLDYALAHVRRFAPRFAKDAGAFLARLGR